MFDFISSPEFIIKEQQDRAIQILMEAQCKQTDRLFILCDGRDVYYCALGLLASHAGIDPKTMSPDTDLELKVVEYWGLFGMNKMIEKLNDEGRSFKEIGTRVRAYVDNIWETRPEIFLNYMKSNQWIMGRMMAQCAA